MNNKSIYQKYLYNQNKIELIFFLFITLFPFSWLLVGSIIYLSIRGIIISLLIMSIIGSPLVFRYFKHNKNIENENFIIEKVKIEGTKFSFLEKSIRVKFSNKTKYKNMPRYEDWKNSSFAYYIKLCETEYYFTNETLQKIT